MIQQNVTIQRKNNQFIIEKQLPDRLSYDIYWGTEPTISKDNKQYLLSSASQLITFDNPNPTQRLYFYLCSEKNHYLIAERKVMIANLNNLRDLGGYLTNDGRLTKFGLLFRSDDLYPLTANECLYLENMNIQSIIDYRSSAERNSRPNKPILTANQYICSPNATIAELASASMETDKERIDQLLKIADSPNAKEYFDKGRLGMEEEMARFVESPLGISAFKSLLEIVKEPLNAPLIQHCRGGKDRTGYGTALILFMLGVPQETIMADYLLTIEMNKVRNEKRMRDYQQYTTHPVVLQALADAMSTQESYLQASFDTMNKLAGNSLAYIQDYLAITEEDILRMKNAYCYSPLN